jgi:uncharacterized caspase-like protein
MLRPVAAPYGHATFCMERRMLGKWCSAISVSMAFAAVAATPPPACAADEHRVALVIGNAAYACADELINPRHDADDMCAALKRLDFETICHNDVRTRKEFLDRVDELANRLKPTSRGLFYYAGHAVQISGENYLVPIQASAQSIADVPKVLVGLSQIPGRLKKTNNAFNMIILDACRDKPFSRGASAAGRGLRVIGNRSPAQSLASSPLAHDVVYGLGTIRDAPRGAIVLYATGSEEAAFDGNGRNGPLTKHLLAHLETPGINVEEMIKRVTSGVESDTPRSIGRRQTPFQYSSFSGEFCFAGCGPKIDSAEVERLRQERADFERKLKERGPATDPAKKEQRVFVPPAL